jgi:hypothetical protein
VEPLTTGAVLQAVKHKARIGHLAVDAGCLPQGWQLSAAAEQGVLVQQRPSCHQLPSSLRLSPLPPPPCRQSSGPGLRMTPQQQHTRSRPQPQHQLCHTHLPAWQAGLTAGQGRQLVLLPRPVAALPAALHMLLLLWVRAQGADALLRAC